MNDLAPCPFCGDTSPMIVHSTVGHESVAHHIECWECDATAKMYADEADSIAAWNRRHVDAAPDVPAIPAEVAATMHEALEWMKEDGRNVRILRGSMEHDEIMVRIDAALAWLDSYAESGEG